MHRPFQTLLIAVSMLLLTGCGESNPHLVDTSNVKVEIKVKRFEKDLFALTEDSLPDQRLDELAKQYPSFFPLFVEEIIKVGAATDPALSYGVRSFLFDPDVQQVYPSCAKEFEQLDDVKADLEYGFKHFKYHFPDQPIPEFTTFYSHFNYPSAILDEQIAIPIEKYLGNKYDFYKRLGIPEYKVLSMSRKGITVDCLKGWVNETFEVDQEKKRILDHMLYQGKLLYALDVMLPEWPDSLKIGYTGAQVEWCFANEVEIWNYLVTNKMLFDNDPATQAKLIGEAPFTPGFPEGSPGRAGHWVGWQIVRAYMRTNDVTLDELFRERDYDKILNKSGYKPKAS